MRLIRSIISRVLLRSGIFRACQSHPSQCGSTAPRWRAWLNDQSGTTSLEWALLLAAIALPCYFIFKMLLATLVEYYRMMTTINALPYP